MSLKLGHRALWASLSPAHTVTLQQRALTRLTGIEIEITAESIAIPKLGCLNCDTVPVWVLSWSAGLYDHAEQAALLQ